MLLSQEDNHEGARVAKASSTAAKSDLDVKQPVNKWLKLGAPAASQAPAVGAATLLNAALIAPVAAMHPNPTTTAPRTVMPAAPAAVAAGATVAGALPSAATVYENTVYMTCPASWTGEAVRLFVEEEFGMLGVQVHHAYVHRQLGRDGKAVAGVFLDFRMGRLRLAEAVKALLAAPPLAVAVDASCSQGSVVVCFGKTKAAAIATAAAHELSGINLGPSASSGGKTTQAMPSEAPTKSPAQSAGTATVLRPLQGCVTATESTGLPLHVSGGVLQLPASGLPAARDTRTKGNQVIMTCPVDWREKTVRCYVEAEFAGTEARVHHVVIRRMPTCGIASCVAEVHLDIHSPRLQETVQAMLGSSPRTVQLADGSGTFAICFDQMNAEALQPLLQQQQQQVRTDALSAAGASLAQGAAVPQLLQQHQANSAANTATTRAAAAAPVCWNKVSMTCPASWTEEAVRKFVHAEFKALGVQVHHASIHRPPAGAPETVAVADVFLDYGMGRQRVAEAIKAMLAAPPLAVETAAGESVVVRFGQCVLSSALDSESSSARGKVLVPLDLHSPAEGGNAEAAGAAVLGIEEDQENAVLQLLYGGIL